jgi:aryl-alcohol dehydrogenase-like predicted oxidoreductase
MEYRKLGRSDLEVSPLCLGTMQFGWTADEASSFAVMDAFVEAGGNFLDTADVYSSWAPGNPGGVSETIIGRWMQAHGNRDRLIIATKVRGQMWEGPDGEGLGRDHILRACEDSLRRLQTDVIDLYQCHHPDFQTPIEETLSAFDQLVRDGKVRYIGASNFGAELMEEALAVSDAKGLPRFVSLQPRYNLVHRAEFETALAALCLREGIGVIPYSPLQGGFLTGKYRPGEPLPKSARAFGAKRYMTEAGWRVIEMLDSIALAHRTTLAAVAVAWLLAKPAVTSPIVGANTVQQLTEVLPAADLRLTSDEIAALDRVSEGIEVQPAY